METKKKLSFLKDFLKKDGANKEVINTLSVIIGGKIKKGEAEAWEESRMLAWERKRGILAETEHIHILEEYPNGRILLALNEKTGEVYREGRIFKSNRIRIQQGVADYHQKKIEEFFAKYGYKFTCPGIRYMGNKCYKGFCDYCDYEDKFKIVKEENRGVI